METIVIFFLIGAAAYFFFRHATKRGTNTVRAYLYLRSLKLGASAIEANQIAQTDVVNGSPQTIRDAKLYAATLYGGKQLPMIAEAVRFGLVL